MAEGEHPVAGWRSRCGGPRRTRDGAPRPASVPLLLLLLVVSLLVLAACGGDHFASVPSTIHVYDDGHGTYATLAEAVQEAPAGATIVLHAGAYTLLKPLDVFRSVHIRGEGASVTTITCRTRNHLIGFSGDGHLSLTDLTLRHTSNGPESDPADIVLARGGRLTMERCAVEGATLGTGHFTGRGGAGVRLLGTAAATLRELRASGNQLAAVVCEPHARPLLDNPAFHDNGYDGVHVLADRSGPTDSAELTRFLDETMSSLLRTLHTPGAVACVVKDGRVMLSKGYGYANRETRTPVDPERTLFRIASLTKVFTAVAALQLAEQGLLELDAEVTTFLPNLDLPVEYAQPLRVEDLLTHSSGFDERTVGMAYRDLARPPALTDYLRHEMPRQVAPAGLLYSYSNYNYAVAGALVQAVAGIPYETYVGTHIIAPLGMTRTTFRPEGALRADVAPGYRWQGSASVPLPPDGASAASAAQLYSTGHDMAQFLLCQLQGGAVGHTRILSTASVRRMLGARFTPAAHLPASGYAYVQQPLANRLPMVQTGDWQGYSALMMLLPEDGLGLFVAANSGGKQLREELLERFMNHYYADRERLYGAQPPSELARDVSRYCGTYRTLRMAHTALDKWLAFDADEDEVVTAEPHGILVIDDTRYVQLEPRVFRERYGEGFALFRQDASGDVTYLSRGTVTYQRLRWYETYVAQRRLVILFSFVFAATFVAWLATPLLGRLRRSLPLLRRLGWRRPAGYVEPPVAQLARAAAGLVALLDMGFLAGAALLITTANLRYGVSTGVRALLVVPIASTTLTVALLAFVFLAWRRGYWGPISRALYTAVVLVALLFVWFLTFWNLLGYHS